MILREWRGRASPGNPEGYPRHFHDTVAPALRAVDGFVGASLLRRVLPDAIEFVVQTRWRSLDAIRAFAGDDIEQAVVEPGAVAALIEFDGWVRHYELLDEVTPSTEAGSQ